MHNQEHRNRNICSLIPLADHSAMLSSNIAKNEAYNDLFKRNSHAWIKGETELVSGVAKEQAFSEQADGKVSCGNMPGLWGKPLVTASMRGVEALINRLREKTTLVRSQQLH